MRDYVGAYLRLEDRAASAESKVAEYRARAEENRWEQCRIAYEATTSGDFNQSSFGREVGKSQQTIGVQCALWDTYHARSSRPDYSAAYAEVRGLPTGKARTRDINIQGARQALKDPDLVRELMADPKVRAVAHEAIQEAHRAQPAPRSQAPSRDDAFLRCVDDMARTEQSLIRLVENLNEGRKNGFLSPSVLREFVEKLRLYADAIDDIAATRGLTDEALAEWIGAE